MEPVVSADSTRGCDPRGAGANPVGLPILPKAGRLRRHRAQGKADEPGGCNPPKPGASPGRAFLSGHSRPRGSTSRAAGSYPAGCGRESHRGHPFGARKAAARPLRRQAFWEAELRGAGHRLETGWFRHRPGCGPGPPASALLRRKLNPARRGAVPKTERSGATRDGVRDLRLPLSGPGARHGARPVGLTPSKR